MGEGGCEVDGYAAAEGVADEIEGGGTGPGERGRGEGEEDLRGVKAGVVREVANAVGEAAAEEVE